MSASSSEVTCGGGETNAEPAKTQSPFPCSFLSVMMNGVFVRGIGLEADGAAAPKMNGGHEGVCSLLPPPPARIPVRISLAYKGD
jgi:hypothetical protein